MFQTQASYLTIYRMVMASAREKNGSSKLIEVSCTLFVLTNIAMVSCWLYHLKLRQCTFQASDEAENFTKHKYECFFIDSY